MRTSLIVAVAANETIGCNGNLPWHLPEDMRRFRKLTSGHVVVVGRRTHQSILKRLGHPLPDRTTVVVTRHPPQQRLQGLHYESSVGAALAVGRTIEATAGGREIFIIGGVMIYLATLPEVQRVYLTRIHADFHGDARMPAGWLEKFVMVAQEKRRPAQQGRPPYTFLQYERM